MISPDGILIHMSGPQFGRVHDARLYAWSQLEERLRIIVVDGHQYVLYGDLAYALSAVLQKPFPRRNIDDDRQEYNTRMARCRMAIEWGFNKITQLFPAIAWHHNQRVLDQPVGAVYQVAALLANCHTCLYGSPTSTYFRVQPPSLDEYLNFY